MQEASRVGIGLSPGTEAPGFPPAMLPETLLRGRHDDAAAQVVEMHSSHLLGPTGSLLAATHTLSRSDSFRCCFSSASSDALLNDLAKTRELAADGGLDVSVETDPCKLNCRVISVHSGIPRGHI